MSGYRPEISTGKTTLIQKLLFLLRRLPAKNEITVRKTPKAPDDIAVFIGKLLRQATKRYCQLTGAILIGQIL